MQPAFNRRAVELGYDTWWKYAALELDDESFLVFLDAGKKKLNVSNQPVAVIQQGCGSRCTYVPIAAHTYRLVHTLVDYESRGMKIIW
jgi:hypothetical protein